MDSCVQHNSPLYSLLRDIFLVVLVALVLSACNASPAPAIAPSRTPAATLNDLPTDTITASTQTLPTETVASPSPEVVVATQDQEVPTLPVPTITPSQRPTLGPGDWMNLPIIPEVSDNARRIYQLGLTSGRDPRAFSKVGDCQVSTDFFLVSFDLSAAYYKLGDYAYLQETIDWFSGSFARTSKSSRDAMRAESLFSSLYADPKACQPGEGPLACEYRLHNPSIAIFSLEQTWAPNIDLEKYARYMRNAIEYTLAQGIVPILATKADNLEGDHQINRILAQLSWEYDIPLWNFWAAVQPLPHHGLISNTPSGKTDMYHLTAGHYFDLSVPIEQRTGWTVRNLTALQALDAVWRGLTAP